MTATALYARPETAPGADTSLDRCDADNIAAAAWAVLLRNGELLFCDHHMREHLRPLSDADYTVLTASDYLSDLAAAEETPAALESP